MNRTSQSMQLAVALAAAGTSLPSFATVLVGNLDQPPRDVTGTPTVLGWAAQSFLTGASGELLSAIDVLVGQRDGSSVIVAELRADSAFGPGALLSGFSVPLLPAGTPQPVSLTPSIVWALTLHDSLTWDGGGVIRLVLGANSAGSDHLELGALIRGADGEFRFDFVDLGIVAGESYELIHFDSLFGFGASDFSFSGVAGNFNLENGRLDFTAAAVPEPSAAWLLAAGMLFLIVVQRRAAGLPGLFKRIPARND